MRIPDRLERNEQIRSMLAAFERSHPGSSARSHRVAVYAVATAERLGFAPAALEHLAAAATLSRVGWQAVEGVEGLGPAAEILRDVAGEATSQSGRILRLVLAFEPMVWRQGSTAKPALEELKLRTPKGDQALVEALESVEPLIQPIVSPS